MKIMLSRYDLRKSINNYGLLHVLAIVEAESISDSMIAAHWANTQWMLKQIMGESTKIEDERARVDHKQTQTLFNLVKGGSKE